MEMSTAYMSTENEMSTDYIQSINPSLTLYLNNIYIVSTDLPALVMIISVPRLWKLRQS